MAEKLHMTEANFSSYERDKSSPPIEKLNQIADLLTVSADYLLGRTDDPQPYSNEPAEPGVQFIKRAREKMSDKAYKELLNFSKRMAELLEQQHGDKDD